MKLKSLLLCLFLIIHVTSCKKGTNAIAEYTSNMETQLAWTDNPAPNIILNPNAHSGNYVCRLESANQYSPTFNMKVGAISKSNFTKVKVGIWMKAEEVNANPTLVVEIRDGNMQPLDWNGKSYSGPVLNTKDWEYYEYELDLKQKNWLDKNNFLRIYCHNKESHAIFCDDLTVSFY